MRVKLKTNLSGPEHQGRPGDVISVSDDFGADLLKGGYAEPAAELAGEQPPKVGKPPKVETATAEPEEEKAVTRKGAKG